MTAPATALQYVRGTERLRPAMIALLTLDWLSHTIFLALYSSSMLVICVLVKLSVSVTCGPGFSQSIHRMLVLGV